MDPNDGRVVSNFIMQTWILQGETLSMYSGTAAHKPDRSATVPWV